MKLAPTNDNSNPQQGNNKNGVRPKKGQTLVSGNGQVTQDVAGGTGTSGRPSKTPSRRLVKVPSTKKDLRKIFVGGIASTVKGDDFLEFFQQFGNVVDSVVMFDKDTGRSRGFGFVTFEKQSVAQALLNKSRCDSELIKIKGKVCELKPAEPKASSAHTNGSEQGYPPVPEAGRGGGRFFEAPMQNSETQYYNSFHELPNTAVACPWVHYPPQQFTPPHHAYPVQHHGIYATPGYVASYNHQFPEYAQGSQVMAHYPAGFPVGYGYPASMFPDTHVAPPGHVTTIEQYSRYPADLPHGATYSTYGMHQPSTPLVPLVDGHPNTEDDKEEENV